MVIAEMTMLDTMDPKTAWCSEFGKLEQSLTSARGAWLLPIRQAAIARFNELGWPTTRDEDWKYTNISPISATVFTSEVDPDPDSAPQPAELLYADSTEDRLVFVNGQFTEDLSSIASPQPGVCICSLTAALDQQRALVEKHLTRYAEYQNDALTALNTAFLSDGLFVYAPKGTVLERPIHAIFISTTNSHPQAVHPRNLVIADSDSELSVLESYVGAGSGVYFNNVVTEVFAADNARIEHYKNVSESEQALHIATLNIQQHRDSTIRGHTVSVGGRLTRNNITTVLDGEGGHCTLDGLNMLSGHQHVDNHLRVEHAKPHCDSREYFKGVYDDSSRGVFSGRIVVHKDAQKTDAKQTNKSLLLSNEALADSKPQLEIFADDVKCTHGATIGQLDDAAVFYMRSRGISEAAAHSVLIYAFANEVLQALRHEPLRNHLRERLLARLPGGHLLRGAP